MDALPSSPLPADLLLDILARCDPVTLVRCAATCKPWYRCITDTAFSRFVRAHTGSRRLCRAGFFFSHRSPAGRHGFKGTRKTLSFSCDAAASPAVRTIRSFLSRNAMESFELVASRGGLVLFRPTTAESPWTRPPLCICNPLTGWRRSIPPPAIYDEKYVLLAGEDGRSFRIVAVDFGKLRSCQLKVQGFRSEAEDDTQGPTADGGGAWSPAIESSPSPPGDFDRVVSPTPVVLGRAAYWLFKARGAYNVLALHVGTAARTACILAPSEPALGSGGAMIPRNQVLLSSTADGRLSLLAAEETRISVWALTMPATAAATAAPAGGGSDSGLGGWSLQAMYERESIARSVEQLHGSRRKLGHPGIDLVRSGERGGVALMRVHGCGSYVVLDTEANEIVRTEVAGSSCIFPYEFDLASMIASMKLF